MTIDKIKVGEIYRVKKTADTSCDANLYWKRNNCKERFIKITKKSGLCDLSYDILDDNKERIGLCCYCFTPEDLEPVEENKGIWIELGGKLIAEKAKLILEAQGYEVTKKPFPSLGDTIHWVSSKGVKHTDTWRDTEKQRQRRDFIGVFRTEEELNEVINKIKSL